MRERDGTPIAVKEWTFPDGPSYRRKLVWRYHLGGRCISTPCIVDGHIYIGNASGTFFCFGP